jgi:hypothetical protein
MILRLIVILAVIILIVSGGMFALTNDRRYLKFAGKVLRAVVFLLLLLAAFYVLERYVFEGLSILI